MATEKTVPEFQIKLRDVRLSFPQLFRAKAIGSDPNSTPKFNCSVLMSKTDPKDKPNLDLIRKTMKEAMAKQWGADPAKQPKIKPDKMCLRDGDQESWDGYEGMLYLSASNTRKPRTLNADKSEATEAGGTLYAGCYVDVIVRVWTQDHKEYGKRVNCSIEGVQFRRHGEAFGAAPVDDDQFDDLSDADDSTGLGGGSDDEDESGVL